VNQEIIDRFWKKVQKTDTCWLWTASVRNKGYGAFAYTLDRKLIQDRAHRFSYRLNMGEIPDGLFVLHRCDNPACVNPDHLFLGTNQENIEDMLRKGRHIPGGTHCGDDGKWKKGTEHPATKLTPEDVIEMRGLYATGGISYSQLGKKFGINPSSACKIVKRLRWAHVGEGGGE
jgi:hypothetical protein